MTETFRKNPATTTLAEAKTWLRKRVRQGAACPCCRQFAMVYERTITGAMAVALIVIERFFRGNTEGEWLHAPTYLTKHCPVGVAIRGGDYAKLVHWGLLEERPAEVRKDGSKRTGYYRITEKGSRFVYGHVTVPMHVAIYNQRPIPSRRPEKFISIHDVLAKGKFARFSYDELMYGPPVVP